MDWKDISGTVAKVAPALGALLAVPTGGASLAIGQAIASALGTEATPDAVANAVKNNPDAALKLQELNNQHEQAMKQLEITSEQNQLSALSAQSDSVNKTMQAEAASEHFPTYAWRPYVGFVVGTIGLMMALTVMVAYVGVMFFDVKVDVLSYIPQMLAAMSGILLTLTPIVGIASYYRGKMQADPNIPTVNRG